MTEAGRSGRQRWVAGVLGVVASYCVVALLVFLPVVPRFGQALQGGPIAGADGWQHTWHVWWTALAVTTGQNPFVTPLLFHPQGALLYVQPLNVSNGLLVLPVTLTFGPVAGYNTAALLSFVLAGLAGYLLALRVSGSHLPAWIGGLAFAWAPLHMTRLYDGQLELMAVQWPAFYAFFALRAVETRRVRDALLAGLMLALTGYTSWYYLLFLLVWSVAFALLWLPRSVGKTEVARADSSPHPEGPERARRNPAPDPRHPQLLRQYGVWLRQWVVIGLTALLVLAPVLIPAMVSLYGPERDLVEVDPEEVRISSANLLDFALPSYLHPLWGPTVAATAGAAWHPLSADWNVALGYTILALALIGGVLAWRQAWRWWVLAGVGMLFALGPELQVGPWQTGVPMPYRLLQTLPGADFARRPLHFTMLTTLALAPLAALGMREVLARVAGQPRGGTPDVSEARQTQRGQPLRSWLVLGTVVGLLSFELLPVRWRLHDAAIHPYYATIAPDDGALLHVPPPLYKAFAPQKAQMSHQAPILGGYLARIPRYDVSYAPGIEPFWQMRPQAGQLLDPVGSALASLNYYGVGQVLINWDAIHPERQPLVEAALAQVLPEVAPTYSDAVLEAYHIPETAAASFGYFGSGWYDEEQNEVQRWRWMGAQGDIMLVNAASTPQRVRILLNLASYAEARDVTIWLDRVPLATHTIPAQPASVVRTLYLLLEPGEHRLILSASSADEENSASQRTLSLVLSGIELAWLQEME
ncbi:hypothetical protein EYB53_021950 [Candidatus Chloroploca sp. M-50]|uniref:Glycosyltransferase RgtA/B/C/D-like domain-containing protein n=1 Tax=Candidatus Chloroploca mongolica TaxID=2528176 RepID=A0ABS4DG37_9CHLR|nr:hypothetical protein [Candidatus Chloroploca mongolica]MBP1468391.1 hypothetical protein [Candidatus Chloroploca mongolica]